MGERPCIVHIRNNASGEVRTMPDTWIGETMEYMWSEGSYSCDCNRAIFFFEGCGVNENADDWQCGDGAFTVWIIDTNGARLYADDDAPAALNPGAN